MIMLTAPELYLNCLSYFTACHARISNLEKVLFLQNVFLPVHSFN